MQGRSLVPLLRGDDPEAVGWRTETYYRYWEHLDGIHHVAAHRGIRTRDRKLVHYYGSGCGQSGASEEVIPEEWELFDLVEDPGEMTSVHDDPRYADDVSRLRAELDRLATELGDTIPPARTAPSSARTAPSSARTAPDATEQPGPTTEKEQS
jgi:hypothetical protein